MSDGLKEIAATMSIDELPESYQPVAEIVGVEGALRLAKHLGGLYFYYPRLDSLLRDKRDAQIRAEFTGCNHRDLARKYALTESWIREIVQRKPAFEQTDIFTSVSTGHNS
jgi:Mor family transcriptional regulator